MTAAEHAYREAIDRLGRTRLRPHLARAHLLYGEWLRRGTRRADARTQLRAAHDLFVTIGMEAFAERARHELIATGDRVRTQTAHARDDLTPQERHVAGLAREGLSNPEIGAQLFLSPRTVEWHLRKVFTKLGIHSRHELLRCAAELRLSCPGRSLPLSSARRDDAPCRSSADQGADQGLRRVRGARRAEQARGHHPLDGLAGGPLHDRDPFCLQAATPRRRHEHHRRHHDRDPVVPDQDSGGADRRPAPAHRGDALARRGARPGPVAGRAAGDAAGARPLLDG